MRVRRSGLSTAAVAGAVVLVIVLVAGAYYIGTSNERVVTTTSVSTSTSTSTTTTTSVTTSTTTSITTALADLETAAKSECPTSASTCVTVYSTQAVSEWTNFYSPAFYAEYPWAQGKVNWISISSSTEAARVISEYQSHQVQASLITGTLGVTVPMGLIGALANYTSPLVKLMNYTAGDYGPFWVGTTRGITSLVYNKAQVTSKNLPIPKAWSDLANPVYKGQIAMQTATALASTGSQFYYLYGIMGNSSWTAMMKGIAANNPVITSTTALAVGDAESGQTTFAVCTFPDFTDNQKNLGATLGLVDLEPLTYTPGTLGIATGAPSPNMAKLLQGWFVSQSGQLAIVKAGRFPMLTALSADANSYLPASYKLVNAFSDTSIWSSSTTSGKWSDLYKAIFGA